jgi:uncharacterized membrane protein
LLHDFLAATSPLNNFFEWMQFHWGADDTHSSYSQALLGSLNFWGLLEGTHLLSLMLFFGTIVVVDSRLMGWTFRKTPVSVVSDRLLPLTVAAMIIAMVTGPVLFFSKPAEYYHNFWFRAKLVFLVIAIANVYIFHKMVQKNQAEWDNAESPPFKAKLSGAVSLISWVLIMGFGRMIAYNFLDCGKPHAAWINSFAECATSPLGSLTPAEYTKQLADQKAADDAAAAAAAAAPAPDPKAAAAPAGAAKTEAK